MTGYVCKLCNHPYGVRVPAAPVVALHLAVSHSGATPIVEMPRTRYIHTGFEAGAL